MKKTTSHTLEIIDRFCCCDLRQKILRKEQVQHISDKCDSAVVVQRYAWAHWWLKKASIFKKGAIGNQPEATVEKKVIIVYTFPIKARWLHDLEGTWHSLQSYKEGKSSWSSRRNGNRILDCTILSPLGRLWWRTRFLDSCSIIGPTPHVGFWKISQNHCERWTKGFLDIKIDLPLTQGSRWQKSHYWMRAVKASQWW